MSRVLTFFVAFFLLVNCGTDPEVDPTPGYEGYTLIWNDEFDSNISPSNWNYELGDGTDYGLAPGWGNAERQLYTSSGNNSLIMQDEEGNSVLAIIAKKEPGTHKYTSAKITTQNLHSTRFGRVEARIKVPQGQGLWPAFWMLGDNIDEIDWPGCGEIDIMEVIGHDPATLHSTVHYANSENKWESNSTAVENPTSLADDYHEYRLDWTPTTMMFSLDGEIIKEVSIEGDMKEFLRSFYIIFNVAVGGNWPGLPDESTVFPQKMMVDWVRVYSQDSLNPPAPPELDIDEETIGAISSSLATHAFSSTVSQFEGLVLKSFGDGGDPSFTSSEIAIDGDSSLFLSYPGGGWGGAFFIKEPTVDFSAFANGQLKFSLKYPQTLEDAEIKLESVATAVSLFLKDYTPVDVGNGFVEYSIPMTDFDGLDLTDLKIPFALWNPVDQNGDYFPVEIYVDNIYFEE